MARSSTRSSNIAQDLAAGLLDNIQRHRAILAVSDIGHSIHRKAPGSSFRVAKTEAF
jgi:hypothetical protein